MGYKLIKPPKGGIESKEWLYVSKSRIYFTKALYQRLGLTLRKKCALIYIDTDTRALCFDFKDYPFRDSFLVSVNTNKQNSTSVCIFCQKTIEKMRIPYGRYQIVSQDGTVFRTDIVLK